MPIVVWPRLELPPAPYEKPADRRSVEPPDGEKKVTATIRKASAALRTVLQRSKVESSKKVEPMRPCHACERRRRWRRSAVWPRTRPSGRSSSTTSARSTTWPTRSPSLDRTALTRWIRWHRHPRRGFRSGPSVTTNLVFAGRFTTTPSASDHARLTSAIIKNIEPNKPHGHAPDCDLFSANSSDNDALRWAVNDQHCTVISQSFHRNSEPGGSGLQSDDLLKDFLALRWPYPTIVQAAGNFFVGDDDGIIPIEDEFVNHKGFNSLAIGNHDDTAGAMSGSSVFRNPTTTHGDRELPELAANGTGVSANGQNKSGTSFAAPATAGVTALLQDVDGVLCSWPEGCRAILMASAGRNVRGGTWWNDVVSGVDARDGAGCRRCTGRCPDRPATPFPRRAGHTARLGCGHPFVECLRSGSPGDVPLSRHRSEPDLLPEGESRAGVGQCRDLVPRHPTRIHAHGRSRPARARQPRRPSRVGSLVGQQL